MKIEEKKERIGSIYLITCIPTGKKYVGQSIDPLRRKQQHFKHIGNYKGGNNYLYRAMNKYDSKDSWSFEIIEDCFEKEKLNEREIFWIIYYKTTDPDFGYNHQKGGSNSYLEDVRNKISKSNKGKKRTPEQLKRLSDAHKGYKPSEETLKKLSTSWKKRYQEGYQNPMKGKRSPMKGKTLSKATRYKMSQSLKEAYKNGTIIPRRGFKMSDEAKFKNSLAHQKRVIVYKNDIYYKEFNCLKDVAEELGYSKKYLNAIITGHSKQGKYTSNGYSFKYAS